MKSNLNFAVSSAANPAERDSRGHALRLWLQKGTQHGAAAVALGPAVRLPVLPQNRAYLKALREAELQAWETAKPLTDVSGKTRPAPPRLPAPERQTGEGRLFAVLAALAVFALASQLRTVLLSASGWRDFADFVQRCLT